MHILDVATDVSGIVASMGMFCSSGGHTSMLQTLFHAIVRKDARLALLHCPISGFFEPQQKLVSYLFISTKRNIEHALKTPSVAFQSMKTSIWSGNLGSAILCPLCPRPAIVIYNCCLCQSQVRGTLFPLVFPLPLSLSFLFFCTLSFLFT